MELRIGARARNAAGIKHLVADLEQGGLRPRLDDDPGSIPADHFRGSLGRRRGSAHLVSTGFTETACTSTRRSRPVVDGRGSSISRRLSGATIGPGAKYPTARM